MKAALVLSKADQQASDESDKLSSAIRRSSKVSLDDLAKQFPLELGQTRPVSVADSVLELGNSKEVKDAIFRLRQGEVSLPIHIDRGYVVLSLQSVQPAHQGTLDRSEERRVG